MKGSLSKPTLRLLHESKLWECRSRWKLDKDLAGYGDTPRRAYMGWLGYHPHVEISALPGVGYVARITGVGIGRVPAGAKFIARTVPALISLIANAAT